MDERPRLAYHYWMKPKAGPKKEDSTPIADFLYEVGMLAKTPRSGFFFLGSGVQSVAEHITRTTYVGYVLAMLSNRSGIPADEAKVIKMCLLHDLGEARTSDLNYVNQKYAKASEHEAVNDLAKLLPFGKDIVASFHEFEDRKTYEAQLAKDADQLELILSLREQSDIGNTRANSWLPNATKRLKTAVAKQVVEAILKTESDHWHFAEKNDGWWVHRNGLKS